MGVDQVVLLARLMLQEVVILVGPVLAVAIVVSLVVNILQVLDIPAGPDLVTGAAPAGHGGRAFSADALDVAASRALHH